MAKKKFKDNESILEAENEKLKKIIKEKDRVIRQKDRTINQLKSEVKTAVDAFLETNNHYREIGESKTLSEAIDDANKGKATRINLKCPKCSSNMKRLLFTGFYIESCKCGYKSRINEEDKITKD